MFRRKRTKGINVRDLANFGNPVKGTVDVGAAASHLGVSPTAIKGALAKTQAALSNTFMRAISGRTAADSSAGASLLGKLQAAFGRGPRGGTVNAAAAAEELGVSETTVRRWAKGTQKPSSDHDETLTTLTAAARRATSTKAGRRALIADFRNSANGKAATSRGATIRISGYQGPSGPKAIKDDYCRDRVTPLSDLTPQHIEDMLRSYEEGGDKGLHKWMTAAAAEPVGADRRPRYAADWEYITIEGFEIEGLT